MYFWRKQNFFDFVMQPKSVIGTFGGETLFLILQKVSRFFFYKT